MTGWGLHTSGRGRFRTVGICFGSAVVADAALRSRHPDDRTKAPMHHHPTPLTSTVDVEVPHVSPQDAAASAALRARSAVGFLILLTSWKGQRDRPYDREQTEAERQAVPWLRQRVLERGRPHADGQERQDEQRTPHNVPDHRHERCPEPLQSPGLHVWDSSDAPSPSTPTHDAPQLPRRSSGPGRHPRTAPVHPGV